MGAAGEEGLKCHACGPACPEEITAISCEQYVYPGGLVQIVYEEEGYRVLFETDNGIELEYDMMGTQG